jgi:hypothetical protein
MHTMLVEIEDGTWRVLVSTGTVYRSEADALDAVVASLPAGSPSPLMVDSCAMPEHRHRGRQVKAIVRHFAASEKTHEIKAKNLRVGYGVKGPGSTAWSRVHRVEVEETRQAIVAYVEWGYIECQPDELLEVQAEVLHPRIVDDHGEEIGLGSLISGGSDPDGEVVELVEPDESHWGVRVKWPEFDEPERFEASPNDPSEDPLYCDAIVAVV